MVLNSAGGLVQVKIHMMVHISVFRTKNACKAFMLVEVLFAWNFSLGLSPSKA